MVARVAEDAGVRALVIKGPRSHHLGLRPARPVLDVDVLIEPRGFPTFRAMMVKLGWRMAPVSVGAQIMELHSVQFRHPQWPMEVDAHHHFPGFFRPAQEVFDRLWNERACWAVGKTPVPVPSVAGAILIEALHLLRDARTPADRIEFLIARSRAETSSVTRLAISTGAQVALSPFLRELGVTDLPDLPSTSENLEKSWKLRTVSGHIEVVPALYELSRTRWRDRPKVVRRLVWLPAWDVMAQSPDLQGHRFGTVRAQCRRWLRAARAMPKAYRAFRASKH